MPYFHHDLFGVGLMLDETSTNITLKFKGGEVRKLTKAYHKLTPCDAPVVAAPVTWQINGKDEDISAFLPALKMLNIGGPELSTAQILKNLDRPVNDSNGRKLRAAYDYFRDKGVVICVSNRGAWVAGSEVCRETHVAEKMLKIKGLTDGLASFINMDIEASKKTYASLTA